MVGYERQRRRRKEIVRKKRQKAWAKQENYLLEIRLRAQTINKRKAS